LSFREHKSRFALLMPASRGADAFMFVAGRKQESFGKRVQPAARFLLAGMLEAGMFLKK